MLTRYYIEIGIVVAILIIGIIIHSITRKKLKSIDGFQGFVKKDYRGSYVGEQENGDSVTTNEQKQD